MSDNQFKVSFHENGWRHDGEVRRPAERGLRIGTAAVLFIHSTWGRESGAQFKHPALGRVLLHHRAVHCGWLGVVAVRDSVSKSERARGYKFVVAEPGKKSWAIAFAAEFVISFILLTTLRPVHQSDLLKPPRLLRRLSPAHLHHLRVATPGDELKPCAQRRLRHSGPKLDCGSGFIFSRRSGRCRSRPSYLNRRQEKLPEGRFQWREVKSAAVFGSAKRTARKSERSVCAAV